MRAETGRHVSRDMKAKKEPVLQGGGVGSFQSKGRADADTEGQMNWAALLGAENRTEWLQPCE